MNPVGAMKSMVGMVGSNLVSSAKHATKQMVSKIRQKADPRSYSSSKKKKNKADNGQNLEATDISDDDNLNDSMLPNRKNNANETRNRDINRESQEIHSNLTHESSDDESILDFRDRVVTEQEFKRLAELLGRDIKMTNRGNSEMEKQIWLTPRRFRTTIRSVQIENLTKIEQKNVFLEFSFGGTLTEVRLLNSNTGQEVPRLLGYPACKEFFTHTVDIKPFYIENNDELLIDIPDENDKDYGIELKNNNSIEISLDETFEWRGSYLHLERELFRIIAWRANSGTVNELLGYNEDILKNYATGSVNQMITLSKITQNNTSNPIFRITLQIIFQEIYDFQLSLSQFTLRNIIDNNNENSSPSEQKHSQNIYNDHEIEFNHDNKSNKKQTCYNNTNIISDQNTVKIDLRDDQELNFNEKGRLISNNHSTSCRLNIKFPSFGIDNPLPTKCTSTWSECYEKQNKIIRWDNIGMIPFRGTIHELERNNLHANLEINSTGKTHNIFKSTKQVHCTFNLKNIVYYPYIQTEIKLPDGESCILEGKIEFGNIPKYHQLGNILEIDDENKLYLIIKIVRIDNLILNIYEVNNILQDTESDDSMDIYVQLSFDGNRKETPVVSGTLHPLFQTELTFILDYIDHEKKPNELDSHSLVKLLERKGPIVIDVWRKNKSSMAQHLGWTEIHWKDILIKSNHSNYSGNEFSDLNLNQQFSPLKFDPSNNLMDNASNTCLGANMLRRQEYRKFYDRNLGKEIVYETRVYQNANVLYNLGQRPSSFATHANEAVLPKVYLEIWTKPDLSSMYSIGSTSALLVRGNSEVVGEVSKYFVDRLNRIVEWSGIGPSLKNSRIRSNIFYWEYVTKSFETWGRKYSYYTLDSRGVRHLLPSFLQPLKPLTGVDNSSKVHHFIHSFPYLPSTNNEIWRTPDLFLLSRQGTPFDHTLLQVCLLLGLNRIAFLACGTLLNRDPYSWAVTIHYEYIMNENGDLFDLNKDENLLKRESHATRARSKRVSALHFGRNKKHSNMRSISPALMKTTSDRKNCKSDKNQILGANRGKMRSLSPISINLGQRMHRKSSIVNDDEHQFGFSKSTETIHDQSHNSSSTNSITQNSIRFYALFWDTVKHVVYRVNDIVQESKHDEFIQWIKEEGYDINQLNQLALESLFSQRSYHQDKYRNIQYKPNFCLKVVNKLPYRTLDLLVNNKNIYANIQQVNDPLKLSYNLNDSKLWYSFFPKKTDQFNHIKMNNQRIQGEIEGKGILNQLPITQNSSNISACFSWPIINLVTDTASSQTGKNNKGRSINGDYIYDNSNNDYFDQDQFGRFNNKDTNINGTIGTEHKSKGKVNKGSKSSIGMSLGLNKSRHEHSSIEKKFLESNVIMDAELDSYCRSINDEIMRYVQIQRFQKSRTIGTRWNRENENMIFLRMGLKLLGKWEMSDPYTREYYKNKSEFLKWRESFLSTVPTKYRMKYAILTFPCNVPKWIAQQVWFKCSFLSNETDKRSIFSLSVDINSWPNNIQSIRILILVVHPLKSNQLRKLQLLQKMNISNSVNNNNSNSNLHQPMKINIKGPSGNEREKVSDSITDDYKKGDDKVTKQGLDKLEIPEFPNELLIKESDKKSVDEDEKGKKEDKGGENKKSESEKERRRASSIIFSDEEDEPELKLLHP
ncbi:C2 domain protein [Cryptosporidium meleagridis]|uniref:C2 domain protein n=1 Tax=Cryptosporidium meleagridis TaxID=93969 RepID=A0A2P4Z1W6_9CRYT|nr:C2 domain protein [Cryptosporidium meleagridis]